MAFLLPAAWIDHGDPGLRRRVHSQSCARSAARLLCGVLHQPVGPRAAGAITSSQRNLDPPPIVSPRTAPLSSAVKFYLHRRNSTIKRVPVSDGLGLFDTLAGQI